MFRMTPFNRINLERRNGSEFSDFYNMVEDFFNEVTDTQYDTFKMDVRENENEYAIEAELPGVQKEEIKIDYQQGNLMISVIRQEEVQEEKDNFIHRERRLASMKRGIYLKNIKAEAISAKLEDGILHMIVPKCEVHENRLQIEIK
ncbi:MAG: Hsp20/alpha crystallin family protein [Cellulosilyticaceae bacterium]